MVTRKHFRTDEVLHLIRKVLDIARAGLGSQVRFKIRIDKPIDLAVKDT